MANKSANSRVGTNARLQMEHQNEQRRNQRRERLAKLLRSLGKTTLMVMVIAAIVGCGYGVYSQYKTAGGLVLSEIIINGNNHLSYEEVADQIPYELGEALTSVDTELIKTKLLDLAWVKKAEVSRSFPGALIIEIEEAKPVALTFDGTWKVISDKGSVLPGSFKRLSALPIINTASSMETQKATEFLVKLQKVSDELYQNVSQMIYNPVAKEYEMYFSGVAFKVVFSDNRYLESCLAEFKVLIEKRNNELLTVKKIDMRFNGFAYIS
jgi:cell division septal protein FtsQ